MHRVRVRNTGDRVSGPVPSCLVHTAVMHASIDLFVLACVDALAHALPLQLCARSTQVIVIMIDHHRGPTLHVRLGLLAGTSWHSVQLEDRPAAPATCAHVSHRRRRSPCFCRAVYNNGITDLPDGLARALTLGN